MREKVEYSNWIPKKIVNILSLVGIVYVFLFVISFFAKTSPLVIILRIVIALVILICAFFYKYMKKARNLLDYNGKNVQGQVLDNLLNYLEWDETKKAKVIDIGCGSGALSIKIAKKYPKSKVTAIDNWGKGWEYSKKQCEKNAEFEDVMRRITFQKGDAASLEFEDGTFDIAVSNLVFHEVRSMPNKTELIKEALRVVKPGGVFVFEDLFFAKKFYGDIDELLKELEKEVSEIHFVDVRGEEFIPNELKTAFVLGDIGLIYGKK